MIAQLFAFAVSLLTDPKRTWTLGGLLLLGELVLNLLIIHNVRYTEIDWEAYMSEVGGVAAGEYDYAKLKGDTGPLVYPAGFVYFFLALFHMTDEGRNIWLAQHIFIGFYLVFFAAVIAIYAKTKMPPYLLAFMSLTSFRIHSIFVLRLFNDPIAMLFLYASVVAFLHKRHTLGSILFSFAVSVKMNILLFAPGLFCVYVLQLGLRGTIPQLALCAALQLFLAAPFLYENAENYVAFAFNFGRQFFYKWTVNWRIVDEDTFLDRKFQVSLLFAHLALVFQFLRRGLAPYGGLKALFRWRPSTTAHLPLDSSQLVYFLFTANLAGMVFSRSLHYQFYTWYYHTLPWLLWQTSLPVVLRFGVLLAIEYAWNKFPATDQSSGVLHLAHAVLILGLFACKTPLERRLQKPEPAAASHTANLKTKKES